MKDSNIFFDRSYGYAKSIVALLFGLVLVIWPEVIKKYIIFILGAIILTIGIVSLAIAFIGKWKSEKVPLLKLNAIVDTIFGLLLLIFPGFFAKLMMFVFGICLLVFGVSDIVNLIRTNKLFKIQWWLYIGPIVTFIIGVVMFFFPESSSNWLFILFGIALLIFAITEFVSTYIIRKGIKQFKQDIENEVKKSEAKPVIEPLIKDVPYEEVDD